MLFKRKIYDQLVRWKQESQGHTAMLIQGVRRVGKSTVAKEFAEKEYQSYILIDFSNVRPEINHLFDDMSNLDFFFLQLQLYTHVDLHERDSLIIFDEVQLQPLARQAIKHLVADGRYDYLETGSLISIRKNIQNILIPSEEECINMYPMDYEEFLWAMGDTVTCPILKKLYDAGKPLGQALHRKEMQQFRLYMLVGGMPQAVNAYLTTNNFRLVDKVKRNIIRLYEEDFRKIDVTGRASQIFDAIPAELSKNAFRYQVSSVIPNQRAEDVLEVVADLEDSMTVLPAFRVGDPAAGLSLTKDIEHFKMFVCDTGLFITLAFKDRDFTENTIYEKLLHGKLSSNLGYVYENITAQTLKASGYDLFYHTFSSPTSNHAYEIDFLLAKGNKICPVEVKSSGYTRHISLDRFRQKYKDQIGESYVIYTKDLKIEDGIRYIPVYMAQFL